MKKLSNYKIIIFDFFGVVSSEIALTWFKKHFPQKDSRELMNTYVRPADTGTITDEQLFATLGGLTNLTGDQVKEEWLSLVTINSEVKSIIQSLKPHFQTVVCSNAPSHFIRTVLEKHELEDLFHTIIVSSEIGYAKPGIEFLNKSMEILNCAPKDVLFIDDTEENIIAAQKFGIDAVVFTGVESLKSSL